MNEIEKDNLNAYTKLLKEQESLSNADKERYRYFEDLYGNHYIWFTHKQNDGKWHAVIKKANRSKRKGWLFYDTVKTRYFAKRKTAKQFCLDSCLKASKHQRKVINDRELRKQAKIDAQPKLTKDEKYTKDAKAKIAHYEKLIAKADTKIKSLVTRKKTYSKRIKYYQKQILVRASIPKTL